MRRTLSNHTEGSRDLVEFPLHLSPAWLVLHFSESVVLTDSVSGLAKRPFNDSQNRSGRNSNVTPHIFKDVRGGLEDR